MDEDYIFREFGVTDEQLDAMAGEYEDGTWDGPVTKPRRGRPRQFDEDNSIVTFRLTRSDIDKLDRLANSHHRTRSEYLRDAVSQLLANV
ncbi:ribbon-helix-helix domain-containing protein [Alloscardovia venturai]|uniref:Ribbon-helix-helix domain-containing protein n=1 Tax=Alloscardovia venturai TaxID=1769421 RepID=A0ABW2Y8F3_9BIFI